MNNNKFDKFFYSVDNSSEHFLSEIENLSDEEYMQSYNGKMFCPRCKGPQLSLVNRSDSSFLRTYPKQPHILIDGKLCPYAFKTASKTTMEKYVKELRDKKKIKSTLEAIMRRLMDLHIPKPTVPRTTDGTSNDPLLIEKEQKDKTIKRSVIPHFSFKTWGKNIPQDQLLVVYGKVHIDLKDTEYQDRDGNTRTLTFIQFRDIPTNKFITSCIKPQEMNISPGNYYAAVLGCCSVNESQGHTYYNLSVNFPDTESILLKPFSP